MAKTKKETTKRVEAEDLQAVANTPSKTDKSNTPEVTFESRTSVGLNKKTAHTSMSSRAGKFEFACKSAIFKRNCILLDLFQESFFHQLVSEIK